jgi:hypothetical protein
MKDMKRLFVIVLVATAFVAGFFNVVLAKEAVPEAKLRQSIELLEGILQDIDILQFLLELKRDLIDYQKKSMLTNQNNKETMDSLRRSGVSVEHEPLLNYVWDEKKECEYLQEVAEIEKKQENALKMKVKFSKILQEAKSMLQQLEQTERKK